MPSPMRRNKTIAVVPSRAQGAAWNAAGRNDARLWRAVLSRDRNADDRFVFAVRSTGIYCRPSCPSRRPRRAQVVFYPAPGAAEHEGFRACRRCRPNMAKPSDPRANAVAKVCRQIEASLTERSGAAENHTLKLSALAASAGISVHQLERAFQRLLGITPRQYADAQRMQRLKTQLRKGDDVTTALYDAGFGSSSRLYERAPEQLGMTPATYRRGGKGMQIGYTIVASPLGRLLVAATQRGISALYLGEDDAKLEAELAREYPHAEIRRNRNGLQESVRALLAHLGGQEPTLELPTDVQATAFQRRVWEELRRIPYGATRTYTQIARAIGKPSAIRAVARACATNPVSVVVPCHRVVREDGKLAGYRWGLDRKKSLQEREQTFAGSPSA
jgi:AraC family transcriptional regulator, regulatory protein of adaptative response / methylated-DNA-[protein]-cysteine methyltransferase